MNNSGTDYVFLPTNRNPKIILVSWNKIALPTFGPKIVVVGGSAEAAHSVSAASLFLPPTTAAGVMRVLRLYRASISLIRAGRRPGGIFIKDE